MAPKVDRNRANRALKALKDQLGFQKNQTAPVLKRLLKVYDDNWEHIEADNYALLVDAILENQEENHGGKGTEDVASDCSSGPSRKKLKSEEEEPNVSCQAEKQPGGFNSISPQADKKGKSVACIAPQKYQRRLINGTTEDPVSFKQIKTSAPALPRNEVVKNVITEFTPQGAILASKIQDIEFPLAMIAPPCPSALSTARMILSAKVSAC